MVSITTALLLSLLICSITLLLYRQFASHHDSRSRQTDSAEKGRTLLVTLGSGGHTTEMLQMMKTIDMSLFEKRIYYVSSGDTLSLQKAQAFESFQNTRHQAVMRRLARARRVKQSWLTTPFTAAQSFLDGMRYLLRDKPDVLICNGPGTCVMLVFAALILRYLRVMQCRILFVESFARVYSLSLSGKILLHLVDRFLVMWPELAEKYEKAEYAGLLI